MLDKWTFLELLLLQQFPGDPFPVDGKCWWTGIHIFQIFSKNLADTEDHTQWCKWKEEQSFSVSNPQKLHITIWPYKSRPPHRVHQKSALTQIKLTRKDAGEHSSGAEEEKEREVHLCRHLRCVPLTAQGLIVGGGTSISLHLSIKWHMTKGKYETQPQVDANVALKKILPPANIILSSWPHRQSP